MLSGGNSRREAVTAMVNAGQRELVAELERLDRGARFGRSGWERPGGGGGQARLLENGDVFERAGVNCSAVHGDRLPEAVARQHGLDPGSAFFATGLSVVIHPRNPYVPAFHASFRYFEFGDTWWFGGGADLTPCYGFAADAAHFHRALKTYCDTFDPAFHAQAKRACDEYFTLPHRDETRGVGGIFFDHLHPEGPDGWHRAAAFTAAGIATIAPAYLPIVRRRKDLPHGDRERQWQLYRRGRYVEFNLVHDRGTRFGLQTGGYVEAILMALPPLARWEFELTPEPGSPEAALAEFLVPRDWAGEEALPETRVAG
ncbi:oxygen-dependent coproporphyrinogen oxidase [Amycolatopsis sp. cmx-8-4]|uniref:oxygen-dependent coproporphyrinogen oxidase n=1 Tax=Amycolatopsis sp. cmx-8-4 TaxID=2790947 RepID=UPI00397D537D